MKKISVSEFNKWKDEIAPKDKFLDIGCWSGATVLELNKKCDAWGADFNQDKLNLADNKIKNKLVYCDIIKNKPFKIEFDWVLMSEVIEHIYDEETAIKNISASLKKGGKLILTTPRSVKFFQIWDPAWVKWKLGGKERHYHYKISELKRLLEKNNLEIKKYSIYGSLSWIMVRWTNVFLRYVLRLNKQISASSKDGFCGWMIYAEKIK
jgi:2-polyprenyl-3-methyl-5-hydroxy-6-metoxy-1,4-benzoquinol methylase